MSDNIYSTSARTPYGGLHHLPRNSLVSEGTTRSRYLFFLHPWPSSPAYQFAYKVEHEEKGHILHVVLRGSFRCAATKASQSKCSFSVNINFTRQNGNNPNSLGERAGCSAQVAAALSEQQQDQQLPGLPLHLLRGVSKVITRL